MITMSTERKPIDTEVLKQMISLAEVAQQYTSLTQISQAGALQGACPLCGGTDRFHVKGDRYYCRQCYPRGGDVIDLLMRVEDISFREACTRLASPSFFPERPVLTNPQTAAQPTEIPQWQTDVFQNSARRTIVATYQRLLSAEGRPGQEYLAGRGIIPVIWQRYQLGYGTTFHPIRYKQEEAIFVPWLTAEGESVTAIQHRFLDSQHEKSERYSLKPGSSLLVFGLHILAPANKVFIVEGEFNCMAINQMGQQAVSVGSESNRGNNKIVTVLQEHLASYEEMVVWFDNLNYSQQFVEQLKKGLPFRKEIRVIDTGGPDANDLLITGGLGAVIN